MIGQIENAIIARLQAASDADVLGYRFKTVDSLPIDVDERLVEFIKQFPSAWTVFAGWKKDQDLGRGKARVTASFHVVVAAMNLRNERSSRMGGTASEVGSYQMVADVVGLLQGQALGLDISDLALGDCATLYSQAKADRPMSLMAVTFSTSFTLSPNPADPADLGDFATFNVDWDVPPHGNIDATSTITLET